MSIETKVTELITKTEKIIDEIFSAEDDALKVIADGKKEISKEIIDAKDEIVKEATEGAKKGIELIIAGVVDDKIEVAKQDIRKERYPWESLNGGVGEEAEVEFSSEGTTITMRPYNFGKIEIKAKVENVSLSRTGERYIKFDADLRDLSEYNDAVKAKFGKEIAGRYIDSVNTKVVSFAISPNTFIGTIEIILISGGFLLGGYFNHHGVYDNTGPVPRAQNLEFDFVIELDSGKKWADDVVSSETRRSRAERIIATREER